MARSSLTITDATAGDLRHFKPALSYAAGRMLTMDGCVSYLLDHWLATHPQAQLLANAGEAARPSARRQGVASGPRK